MVRRQPRGSQRPARRLVRLGRRQAGRFAAVELAARATGAYATVREQFNLPIGRFEGVEEALTRIAGHAYLMNAARVLTCAAVDAGEKPAVLSAVVKAYLTEGMRKSVIANRIMTWLCPVYVLSFTREADKCVAYRTPLFR